MLSDSKVFTVHDLTTYTDGDLLLNRCLHLSDLHALSKGTLGFNKYNEVVRIPDDNGQVQEMTMKEKMNFVSDWYLNKNWNIKPANILYGLHGDHRSAQH